ncbi:MAG TPA: cytochrome P460 family protein [Amaricoccus sp.]|uniref:cytochrome P460 family protein n=1 Tax=Amaricoccus sp. TaxID=1872485 RepID=UPI002C637148|nr:cytochrome P460 family protein [Amaricoccus sp.]HMQ94532.1 cytochrome P460 family protein [Amaricoccus sp.]HMR54706.1 cytochrome P460 family protein [Amaricoccus sp.]HMU01530.1 cytochrome P460 family protein [Amaricoccus sp.]
MKRPRTSFALLGLVAATPVIAQVLNSDVLLRDGYRDESHYATVVRGGITEEIYTSQTALAAARASEPLPDGTVITMDDFRDGALYRILVMEKRSEWADASEAGSWLFREFAADGTPNLTEDGMRCQSCHASQFANDYVFTYGRMTD